MKLTNKKLPFNRQLAHFFNIKVPIGHRLEKYKITLPNGAVNKYFLAEKLGNQVGTVLGGGYAIGTCDYDVDIYIPQNKVKFFKSLLKNNHIRYKYYGVESLVDENYYDYFTPSGKFKTYVNLKDIELV